MKAITNKQNNNIPIVMIIDPNAIKPFATAVRSIAENTSIPVEIKVVGVEINDDTRELIYLANEKNVNIEFIDASHYLPRVNKYDNTNKHVSSAALLKFFLPEIFEEYDRLLYLDVDILVRRDLRSILNEDIDNVYAGVVENLVKPKNDENDYIYRRGSFNSGVILMNCSLMRRDNISKRLIDAKKNIVNDNFMDQTAFNIVFKDRVKLLPLQYNYLSLFDLHDLDELNNYYGTQYSTDNELCRDITILHLAGTFKPWKYSDGYYRKEWEETYLRSPIGRLLGLEQLPHSKKERKKYIFKIRNWQELNFVYLCGFSIRASYYDGVNWNKKYFLSRQPFNKCLFRHVCD